jgi:hypothetical protein
MRLSNIFICSVFIVYIGTAIVAPASYAAEDTIDGHAILKRIVSDRVNLRHADLKFQVENTRIDKKNLEKKLQKIDLEYLASRENIYIHATFRDSDNTVIQNYTVCNGCIPGSGWIWKDHHRSTTAAYEFKVGTKSIGDSFLTEPVYVGLLIFGPESIRLSYVERAYGPDLYSAPVVRAIDQNSWELTSKRGTDVKRRLVISKATHYRISSIDVSSSIEESVDMLKATYPSESAIFPSKIEISRETKTHIDTQIVTVTHADFRPVDPSRFKPSLLELKYNSAVVVPTPTKDHPNAQSIHFFNGNTVQRTPPDPEEYLKDKVIPTRPTTANGTRWILPTSLLLIVAALIGIIRYLRNRS